MAKAKSKNPIGRPRFEVTPKVIQSAEQFMAQGLTREQCAANLGISRSKFFEIYQEQNVDFLDAIKKGEARGIGDVTNALFENATVKKITWLLSSI
jgi:DNA invertase Pin-like site-specific DNA recombinase